MQQVDLTSFFLNLCFFEIFQKNSSCFRLRSKLCTLKPLAPPLVFVFLRHLLQVLCCAADILLSIIVKKKRTNGGKNFNLVTTSFSVLFFFTFILPYLFFSCVVFFQLNYFFQLFFISSEQ
jgi:hypothetical protein